MASAEPMPPNEDGPRGAFVAKVRELRRRAHAHIGKAGLTPGHAADKQIVLSLLSAALSTKLVSAQRYRQHYFESDGLLDEEARKAFLAHSNENQAQAVRIDERIVQLGGDPELDPENRLSGEATDDEEGQDLETLIKDDLVAGKIAIEAYQEMIGYLERRDHTTRRPDRHEEKCMLVLTRRPGQTIRIGDDIEITVIDVRERQIRLGIAAPRQVSVDRQEVAQRKQAERDQADREAGRGGTLRPAPRQG